MKNKSSKLEIAPAEKPTKKLARTRRPSSLKQIEASRLNGAKSRGPKTRRGKDRSRQNALIHGVFAKCLSPGSTHLVDRRQFDEVLSALKLEYRPQSQMALMATECLAVDMFRLQTILRLQDHELDPSLAERPRWGMSLEQNLGMSTSGMGTGGLAHVVPVEPAIRLADLLRRLLDAFKSGQPPHLSDAELLEACEYIKELRRDVQSRLEASRAELRELRAEIAEEKAEAEESARAEAASGRSSESPSCENETKEAENTKPESSQPAPSETEKKTCDPVQTYNDELLQETLEEINGKLKLLRVFRDAGIREGTDDDLSELLVAPKCGTQKMLQVLNFAVNTAEGRVQQLREGNQIADRSQREYMEGPVLPRPDRVELLLRYESHVRRAIDKDHDMLETVLKRDRVRFEELQTDEPNELDSGTDPFAVQAVVRLAALVEFVFGGPEGVAAQAAQQESRFDVDLLKRRLEAFHNVVALPVRRRPGTTICEPDWGAMTPEAVNARKKECLELFGIGGGGDGTPGDAGEAK